MIITFVHHSCFVIETEERVLIFDYFRNGRVKGYNFTGVLPKFDQKKSLYVFASHFHQDHFDLEILRWAEKYPKIRYILSKDIRLSGRYLEKNGIPHSVKEKITFVQPLKNYEVDDMKIRTLRSTDAGVAFLIKAEGKYIYHAGDLNLWKWEGAGDLVNGKEARAYKHEINKLSDYTIDVAFVPLDSRQKKFAAAGLYYFMEHVNAKVVFPMHMWQDYGYIDAFKSQISNDAFARRLVDISGENESYALSGDPLSLSAVMREKV